MTTKETTTKLLARLIHITPIFSMDFKQRTFLLIFRKKSGRRSAVLIAGPCDGGKTLIFSRLVTAGKSGVGTFTSMQENLGHFQTPNTGKKVTVVDMPGHDRIR